MALVKNFKIAANLSFLFKEVGFLERFENAAKCGFAGVEFGGEVPSSWTKEQLLEAKQKAGVEVVVICTPTGLRPGDKGLAAMPGREDDFKASLATGIEYAKTLDCKLLHPLAGAFTEEVQCGDSRWLTAKDTYVTNLRYAAEMCAKDGITVVIEPISTIPNYFLRHQQQAIDIIEEVGCSNLKLEFDTFHAQTLDGNLCEFLTKNIQHIGHIQISQVPGRHEPDDNGEINFPFLYRTLTTAGYKGWLGCEYTPKGTTEAGLQWFWRAE